MTHPTDYFFHPQPKSVQDLHTQESGDDGLSSNMEHRFNHYNESALPVPDKGSFVIPIPKEELDDLRRPAKTGKVWSLPSMLIFDDAAGPKIHHVSAEEGLIKAAPQAVMPPQTLPENNQEETSVMVPPGTTAITEMQPDVEEAGNEGCNNMDTGENPAKPEDPPRVRGDGRNNNRRRKRAAAKNWKMYLVCLMPLMLVPVSEGFPGAQPAGDRQSKCFTCMDKDRCPNLVTIYDRAHDTLLYQRDLNETFPECSEIPQPGSKSCSVCQDQFNVTIVCSGDVGKVDVEDSDGGQIVNISPGCVRQQIPGRRRDGLIAGFAIFLVVVGGLVIYRLSEKKRTESGQQ